MHTFTTGQIFFTLIVLAASFMLIHYTITIPLQRQVDAVRDLHYPFELENEFDEILVLCAACGSIEEPWGMFYFQNYPCATIKALDGVK